jgi:hypothetical protein
LPDSIVFVLSLILAAGLGFAVGIVSGVFLGDASAYTDFCLDDGTSRYIEDPYARSASCERLQ